jgi:hypothetical protein
MTKKQQEVNTTNNWIPRGAIRVAKLPKEWKPKRATERRGKHESR